MAEHNHFEHVDDKRTALFIAVLALFLALVETGANNAQTESIAKNVEAANFWAYFQARTIRQTTLKTAIEQTELEKATISDPNVRATLQAQQNKWQDTVARWESEPDTGEGRLELAERAKSKEEERDLAAAKHHLYEYSAALFQVAIVVVSSSIVTSVPLLVVLGAVFGLGGVGLGLIGFFAPLAIHF